MLDSYRSQNVSRSPQSAANRSATPARAAPSSPPSVSLIDMALPAAAGDAEDAADDEMLLLEDEDAESDVELKPEDAAPVWTGPDATSAADAVEDEVSSTDGVLEDESVSIGVLVGVLPGALVMVAASDSVAASVVGVGVAFGP